jgi:hypothetical protein
VPFSVAARNFPEGTKMLTVAPGQLGPGALNLYVAQFQREPEL